MRDQDLVTKKYSKYENVFIANSGERDTIGDVVDMEGMDLSRFNANGMVFYQHAGYFTADPDSVIAKGEAWVDGKRLMLGISKWDTTEYAQEVKRKVDEDFIVAASIGFIPTKQRYDEETRTYFIEKSELLEVSVVNIPADPKAVKVKSLGVNPPVVTDLSRETKRKQVTNYLLVKRSRL